MSKIIGEWGKPHGNGERPGKPVLSPSERFSQALRPAETLLRSSGGSGTRFDEETWRAFLFSALLAILLVSSVSRFEDVFLSVAASIVGIGLVGVALAWLIHGPERQVYAITNQRILIFDPWFPFRLQTIRQEQINCLRAKGSSDFGDVIFHTNTSVGAKWLSGETIGFFGVKNPLDFAGEIRKAFHLGLHIENDTK